MRHGKKKISVRGSKNAARYGKPLTIMQMNTQSHSAQKWVLNYLVDKYKSIPLSICYRISWNYHNYLCQAGEWTTLGYCQCSHHKL